MVTAQQGAAAPPEHLPPGPAVSTRRQVHRREVEQQKVSSSQPGPWHSQREKLPLMTGSFPQSC